MSLCRTPSGGAPYWIGAPLSEGWPDGRSFLTGAAAAERHYQSGPFLSGDTRKRRNRKELLKGECIVSTKGHGE